MRASAYRVAEATQRYEELLARCGVKDRANIEKHVATCEAEPNPGHAHLWRRIAGSLGALAPMPAQTLGQQVVLFFIPDGKYRMQVFALEDRNDGKIIVYLPNVLTQALREKIIAKSGSHYTPADAPSDPLSLIAMDAANTTNPPQHVKNMIGWNRKAVMITLDATDPNSSHAAATEALCALAAKQWVSKAAAATAAK
jgi:hypothetical protein